MTSSTHDVDQGKARAETSDVGYHGFLPPADGAPSPGGHVRGHDNVVEVVEREAGWMRRGIVLAGVDIPGVDKRTGNSPPFDSIVQGSLIDDRPAPDIHDDG